MLEDPTISERLEHKTSELAAAGGPSAVFRILLESFELAAPRAAILLVRQGTLKGWACHGYPDEAAGRLRGLTLPVGSGWPGRLTDPAQPRRSSPQEGSESVDLDFGQPTSDECLGFAVRVGGKTLAVLIVERDLDQEPWNPAVVGLLAAVSEIRLELDLARRKLGRITGAAATPQPAPERSGAPATEPRTTSSEDRKSDTDGDLAPASDRPSTQPGLATREDPVRSAARRFARLVATDIRLYNEESVMLGRKNGDLFDRVKEHLDRGRETFQRRFPDLGDDGHRILRDAYVQVLAAGDEALLPADAVS